MMSISNYKLVIVGDGAVGKTSLLYSYAKDKFLTDHIPTVFDTYSVMVSYINQRAIQLTLYDTAGQEDYDRLRPLSYPSTNIFLVCFDVSTPSSLDNCADIWVPEISYHSRGTPFILVGLKTDLRRDDVTVEPGSSKKAPRRGDVANQVSRDMGRKVAKRIGASGYAECSALTQDGVKAVFDEAVIEVTAKARRCRYKKHKLRRTSIYKLLRRVGLARRYSLRHL